MHHVYAQGNDQQLIYRDVVDRETYLAMLARVVALTGWRCLAYLGAAGGDPAARYADLLAA